MSGNIGFLRNENNRLSKAILVNGKSLNYDKQNFKSTGRISGKIVKMNKNPAGSGWVLVDQLLPDNGSLNGEQLIISTEGERNASYTIKSIKREGKYSRIDCGSITFAMGIKPVSDLSKSDQVPEYIYEFEEGASFSIASHQEWNLKSAK